VPFENDEFFLLRADLLLIAGLRVSPSVVISDSSISGILSLSANSAIDCGVSVCSCKLSYSLLRLWLSLLVSGGSDDLKEEFELHQGS
jgi:hypothetical protein